MEADDKTADDKMANNKAADDKVANNKVANKKERKDIASVGFTNDLPAAVASLDIQI